MTLQTAHYFRCVHFNVIYSLDWSRNWWDAKQSAHHSSTPPNIWLQSSAIRPSQWKLKTAEKEEMFKVAFNQTAWSKRLSVDFTVNHRFNISRRAKSNLLRTSRSMIILVKLSKRSLIFIWLISVRNSKNINKRLICIWIIWGFTVSSQSLLWNHLLNL